MPKAYRYLHSAPAFAIGVLTQDRRRTTLPIKAMAPINRRQKGIWDDKKAMGSGRIYALCSPAEPKLGDPLGDQGVRNRTEFLRTTALAGRRYQKSQHNLHTTLHRAIVQDLIENAARLKT